LHDEDELTLQVFHSLLSWHLLTEVSSLIHTLKKVSYEGERGLIVIIYYQLELAKIRQASVMC
jgi:hypothetical protein